MHLFCCVAVYGKCNAAGGILCTPLPKPAVGGLLVSLGTLNLTVGHDIAVAGLAL